MQMMVSLTKILIVLLLTLKAVIAQDEGRYFTYAEVDKIVDETASNVALEYQEKIHWLKEDMAQLIQDQRKHIQSLSNHYESKISLLSQKHDLVLQANSIKLKHQRNIFFTGGIGAGVAISVGTALLVNTFNFPLFKIQF